MCVGSPSSLKNACPNCFLDKSSPYVHLSKVSAVQLSAELGHINIEAASQVPRRDLNLISADIV